MVANHQSALDAFIFGDLWDVNFRVRRGRTRTARAPGCRPCDARSLIAAVRRACR